MRHWFSDGVFRTVLRNAGYLISGKAAGAVLGLLALSLVGRGLGPSLFGTLALIHAFATGAAAVTKFQSWEVVIRYGAPALVRGDDRTVADSIRLAFGLDIASGLGGMAAAMLLLPWLAPRFGIGPDWLPLAIGYCTLIPTMGSGTPTGVLRLHGRFDLTAWQQIVSPVVRVTGAALCYAAGLGFPTYVAVWYAADLSGDLVNWAMAIREMRRRGALASLRPALRAPFRRLPDSWSFVWTTNLAISLTAGWNSIANLVVGGVLGPAAAGLFRIASTVVDAAGKPADMLTRGFYPEIMRLDPTSTRPWLVAMRTGLIAGGIGLVAIAIILAGGRPLILAAFGPRYLPAYGLLTLMMAALAVSMASFPLQSLLYMVHRQRAALVAQGTATLGYLALLATLARTHGLMGAGTAFVLGNLLLAGCLFVPVWGSWRRRADVPRAIA